MLHVWGLISATFLAGATAQPVPVQAPRPCTISQAGEKDILVGLRSIEELIDGSKFIVDAIVQSTGPGVPITGVPTSLREESGALLLVTSVLKGPETLQQFAVSTYYGGGELELHPGQRFILFLHDVSLARSQLMPQHPGVPNYATSIIGTFCVENGRILLSTGNVLSGKYAGASVEKALTDIRSHVGRPRIKGLIQVEGGVFPPAGSIFRVPLTDDGAALRVVVRPEDSKSTAPPVVLDRGGAFTLALDRGSYRVDVEGLPFGYAVKSMTYGTVDLTTEPLRISGPDGLDLRITLSGKTPGTAPTGVRVQGRVTGITTAVDLARIWVTMVADGKDARSGAIQPTRDGDFEFLNVPPGRYTVKVAPPPGNLLGLMWAVQSEAALDVAERDASIVLPLYGGVEVKGRMVDRNGTAVGNTVYMLFAPVGVANAGGAPVRPHEVRALPDGTFAIWLPRGEYTVTVPAFGGPRGAPRASARTAMSGGVDLLKTPLKLDGAPVDPIVVTVE